MLLVLGGWVIYKSGICLFMDGEVFSVGLEVVVEDGNNEEFINDFMVWMGYIFLYVLGVWVVYDVNNMLIFVDGMVDVGEGLEELVEDGDLSILVVSLSNGIKVF